ncbi:hypothetical protein I9W82_000807 [Candida metapsilosis]|uniref:Uncharacterized protein n=1 Tax=Candida metapsilosis TaxID=273372 RepID=A0A8H8DE33_9ASCO|nr:hypothetical protein I9W82_000807 [Candida metapsilosis]
MSGLELPVKKVSQIPTIYGQYIRDKLQYRTKTFCLVLRVFPVDEARCRVDVTDFTAHVQISDEVGENEKEYRFLKTDENKVLRVISFKDKIQMLAQKYEDLYPGQKVNLPKAEEDEMFSKILDDKLMVVSMTMWWREYRGILEPYTYDPDIVEYDYLQAHEKKVVDDLYKKILKKREYIKALNGLEKVIIPADVLNKVTYDDDDDISEMSSFEDDDELSGEEESTSIGSQSNQNYGANNLSSACVSESVIGVPNSSESFKNQDKRHKRVKSDAEVQEIPKRTKQGSSSADENGFYDVASENNSAVNVTTPRDGITYSTVSGLNKLNSTIDNTIYMVYCEIIHATPSNKELFTYKSYEVNPVTEEIELSHTRLQGIEFIITDPGKSSNSLLQEEEYSSIYLDGDQVLALSKSNSEAKQLLDFAWDKKKDCTVLKLKVLKVQRHVVQWTVVW